MQIAHHSVVSFDYTLTGPDGKTLDSSVGRAPLVYLHGTGGIIPGLEHEMEGKNPADRFTVTVPAEKAYGVSNPNLIQVVPRGQFPAGQMIMVGQEFQATAPSGQNVTVRVTKVTDADVTVDGNHPLAGVPLTFDVTIVDVRAATEEEIAHGHVHGAGGHHH